MNNRLINTKVAGGGGGCTDIVDNYDPFDGNGVALYQLNGNANDVSGNYNGTASNVTYGTGVFGQAGVFNGSSSVVDLGSTIDNPLRAAGEFGISLWVNINSYTLNNSILKLLNDTYILIIYNSSNEIECRVQDSSDAVKVIKTPVSLNTWYHVVWTGNSTNGATLYLNGSSVGNIPWNGTYSIYTNPTYKLNNLGYNGGGDGYYDGQIDQTRIFNRALTPLEVEALYTEELCICDGTVDTLDILGDGSCIATYQLDGNANDLSGNYSGTPTDVSYGVGEFDLAGVFNGSSSAINTPLNTTNIVSNINDITQNFSFSLWIKPQAYGSSNVVFSINAGDPTYQYIGLVMTATGVNFVHYPGGASGNVVSTTTDLDVWTQITCIRESSYLKLYKNGTFIGQELITTGNSTIPSDKFWAIGYRPSLNDLYFNGSIDQVRIFNKALNSTEVTTLYNESACTHTPSACVDVFGDDSGIALYDLNGDAFDTDKKYNGQLIGSPTLITGKFGDAYSCTNTDYVLTPQYVFSTSYTDGISVSLWAKFTSANYQTPISTFVSLDPRSSGFYFRTSTGGNGANWNFNKANGDSIFTALAGELSVTLNDGNWHHIAMTWTGDTSTNGIKLYVDNNLLDQRTASETIASQAFVLGHRFGNDLQSANRFCSVDQIRFFKKDLSSAEVTTLYTSDASCG